MPICNWIHFWLNTKFSGRSAFRKRLLVSHKSRYGGIKWKNIFTCNHKLTIDFLNSWFEFFQFIRIKRFWSFSSFFLNFSLIAAQDSNGAHILTTEEMEGTEVLKIPGTYPVRESTTIGNFVVETIPVSHDILTRMFHRFINFTYIWKCWNTFYFTLFLHWK